MNSKQKNNITILFVVLVVAILLVLVRVGMQAGRYKNFYQEEIAKRLDVEERMDKLEKERARLLSELDVLSSQLADSKQEITSLKKELSELKEKDTALRN